MTATSFAQANQLFKEGKIEEAIAFYKKATTKSNQFYCSHHNLGEALIKAGRIKEAAAAFREALAINPNSAWSLYKLGAMLNKLGQYKEAVGYLRQAVEKKTNVPEFYLSLGRALVHLGQWSDAEESLYQVVDFCVDSLPLEEEAKQVYGTSLMTFYVSEAYFYLGDIKFGQQQWSEAVKFYRQSWETNYGKLECCMGWAASLGKLGRWSEVVECYRQSAHLFDESEEFLFGFGQALSQLGRWKEAVVKYRLVVEINPKSAEFRHHLGYALMQLKYWVQAEIELRKAAELHPASTVFWQHLGNVLRELGKREEAVKVYQRGQQIDTVSVSPKQIADKQLLERVRKYLKASKSKKKNVVVYTAICNNYDVLKIPEFLCPDWDYVCFTDRAQYPGEHCWEIRHFDYIHEDSTRTARYVKTHPHIYFNNYEYSIWIDAHILVKSNFLEEFLNSFIKNQQLFAAIPHPYRNCTYQEANICSQQEKDDKDTIEEQTTHYQQEGLPYELGLIETGVMIRKHNDNCIRNLHNLWWEEIEKYSKRDQLSVMFALWKTDLKWIPLMKKGRSTRNHPGFGFFQHGLRSTTRDIPYQIPSFLPKEFAFEQTPFWHSKTKPYDRNSLKSISAFPIDIVICVHNALEHVKNCINSVLVNLLPSHKIIIVDDGSDYDTWDYLKQIAAQNHSITLVRHEIAKGYTKSANLGMQIADAEFVILLNSDTIVSPDWALKLLQTAMSSNLIGVVGPMSNAASWQSLPFVKDPKNGGMIINELPEGKTVADMDKFCEQYGWFGHFPRVPLINGFCYGIKREVIDAIGYFDEEAFPKGYGEEDDYSMRALNAGFTHALATHCYVFHAKSKSFGAETRSVLAEAGGNALRARHGEKRIKRAVISLNFHPFLKRLRAYAGEYYGVEVLEKGLTKLSSVPKNTNLPESSDLPKSTNLPESSGPSDSPQKLANYDLSQLTKINSVIFPKELLLVKISLQELQENSVFTENMRGKPLEEPPGKVLWIIPNCRNILAGGIRTVFMVAEEFSRSWNSKNVFLIQMTSPTEVFLDKSTIKKFFPDLNFELIVFNFDDNPKEIPRTDIAFCTAWHTAYLLARYNNCQAKFYFMQDDESLFYPAGSVSGTIDMTYRFGFHCIANSLGIAEKYKQYGDNVTYFTPGIDRSIYYPKPYSKNKLPWQVVFYGRPKNKRNAFALGIEALKLVKLHFQDNVRIVSVGSDWKPKDYGLESIIENLGVLDSLEKVAELYGNSHVGLVFMLTPHPSYQPLEYMASGCATVSNYNLGTSWLFQHEQNSLLSSLLPDDVAGNIIRLLENNQLREQIIKGGLETTKKMDWKFAFERIKEFVINPDSDDTKNYRISNAEKISINPRDEFIKILREGNFDYLDFGCSKGNSLNWSKRLFGGKQGLGIDIDPKKIAQAKAAGHNAVIFDINNIPTKKLVRFTVLSHLLQNLPSENDVKAFVRKACQVSTDFVFIKQPYFDADGYLFQNGLKLFFSDWTGHPNQMTTLSLFKLMKELKDEGLLQKFSIHGKKPILSSDDNHVQSINAPIDQHHFDSSKHPPKIQGLKFEFPVFYETVVMISISGVSHYEYFKKFPTDATFFESWSVD